MTQSLLKPKALNKEVGPNTYKVTLLTFIFDISGTEIANFKESFSRCRRTELFQSINIISAIVISKNSNWGHYHLLPNLDYKELTEYQCGGLAAFMQSCL